MQIDPVGPEGKLQAMGTEILLKYRQLIFAQKGTHTDGVTHKFPDTFMRV